VPGFSSNKEFTMDWYTLIRPLGIITYSLVFLNVLFGLFIRKIRFKFKLQLHKFAGITIAALASAHFLLVLIYAG